MEERRGEREKGQRGNVDPMWKMLKPVVFNEVAW
jgi:hypothetical protein